MTNDTLNENQGLSTSIQSFTEMEKPSTDVAQFKPTPAMMIWLTAAIRTESDSPSEIAEACDPKIDRTNWYKWLDIPGFIDWYNGEWSKKLRSIAPKLDMIGLKNAKKDHKYWQDMQKRVGNLKESEGNGNVNMDVKILITRGS